MITWLKGVWPQKRKPRFKKRNNVTIFFFLKLCFTTFNLEPIFKYEPNFQRDLIGVKLFTGLVQTYELSLLICVHVCACMCVCVYVCSASLRISIAHIIQNTRQSPFLYAYCIQLNSGNDQFMITSVMALSVFICMFLLDFNSYRTVFKTSLDFINCCT